MMVNFVMSKMPDSAFPLVPRSEPEGVRKRQQVHDCEPVGARTRILVLSGHMLKSGFVDRIEQQWLVTDGLPGMIDRKRRATEVVRHNRNNGCGSIETRLAAALHCVYLVPTQRLRARHPIIRGCNVLKKCVLNLT